MVGEPENATDSTGQGDVVERLSADEAFALLSNETRLGILRELFGVEGPRGFAELREAVGTRDSGQFNYHLDKLCGSFVQEAEDGYELTAAGGHVVGAILAGRYTKTTEGPPVEVDSACHHCGESLAGIFDEDRVRVACTGCDRNVISFDPPPGIFEAHPREEWPSVAERWTRNEFAAIEDGFCPFCRGSMTSRLERVPEGLIDVFDVGVHYVCERCGQDMYANAEASVISHPAVVAFHYERGIDVEETPIWELEWAVRSAADVVSQDPLRVEVPIDLAGDRLVLTLDERAEVIEERRE